MRATCKVPPVQGNAFGHCAVVNIFFNIKKRDGFWSNDGRLAEGGHLCAGATGGPGGCGEGPVFLGELVQARFQPLNLAVQLRHPPLRRLAHLSHLPAHVHLSLCQDQRSERSDKRSPCTCNANMATDMLTQKAFSFTADGTHSPQRQEERLASFCKSLKFAQDMRTWSKAGDHRVPS